MDDTQIPDAIPPLLAPDEPPAATRINSEGQAPLVLCCDHASNRVPRALGNLGLAPDQFQRHIAYDPGAEAITRILSEELDSNAVLAGYSRLVVDLNRPEGHPQGIPTVSDKTTIPGNQNLNRDQVLARLEGIFEPYHLMLQHTVSEVWTRGAAPALFSIHSFTPHYGDTPRPWDAGVIWNRDPRLALPLMAALRERGLNIGENEPYSGLDLAYTLDVHGGAAGLANCAIEINQEQVRDEAGAERWAALLVDVFKQLLTRENLYKVEFF